jgi:hypothetical protein
MTDIEELVRESLRTAPAVVPSVADPVGAVAGRVRRARVLWGGGVAAVAATVVAAVVVPLSLIPDAAGRGRLVPSSPPPSADSPPARGVTVWQQQDAVAVTSGGGWLWELERNPKASDGAGYVVKVDPRSHEQVQKWDVQAPYDFIEFGLDRVWVWGGGDGAYPDGKLQSIDPASSDGCPCDQFGNRGHSYGGVAFLAGHPWVTTGSAVWELSADARRVVWSHTFQEMRSPGPIYAAAEKLFVQTSPTAIASITPDPGRVGARLGLTQAVMDATIRLLGVEGDLLLVSTGEDVEPQVSDGTDTLGNALFDAAPAAVAALPNHDVVVATTGTALVEPALWLARAVRSNGTLCAECVRKIATGLDVRGLTTNPYGGADFVLADGTAAHWQP